MNQACYHATGPYAGIYVTVHHGLWVNPSHLINDVLELNILAEGRLFLYQSLDGRIVKNTLSIF